MPGIADQIRELVRSVTNHARRIRRLETLQAPLAVARPQGGHIIQDEGVVLTERVYLNFVGVRVEASDDPDNGATIITVSDPDGDDFCRVVPLDVGWQITAGTESRYMKHSTAFQLSSGGDTRGAYAIDLQQVRTADGQVAASDYSAILGGLRNEIIPDAPYCMIVGSWNTIEETLGGSAPSECWIVGDANTLDTDSFALFVSGTSHSIEWANYGSYFGYSHDIETAFGCFSFIEQNHIFGNINDDPTYSASGGLFNVMEGDVWLSFQWGEDNYMYGLGAAADDQVLWCAQFGYQNYLGNVLNNYAFGRAAKSYRPTGDQFYDGRIIWSGEWPNEYPSDGIRPGSGFNQDSWFSQNDKITNWTVAWITSRFEFPIIQDSIWGFTACILGTELGCANTYDWRIRGMVENDGGTTTIKWSIVDNYYRDVATKEWQVVADDPNDRLVFQFRDTAGPDATDCNIQLSMFTVEVGFET